MNLFSQELDFTKEELEFIENNRIVYFGYDPNWSPYEIYSNGKYSGICGDFLDLISKKVGVKFIPLKNMNWEKSYKDLKNDNISMVTAAGISKERLEFLIFTDTYIKLPVVLSVKLPICTFPSFTSIPTNEALGRLIFLISLFCKIVLLALPTLSCIPLN